MAHPKQSFAVVTVSYAPDFERCQLLAESTEKCLLGDAKHYIIVDRRDYQLFTRLASSKIEVLVVENILPWWIFRPPFLNKGWLSLRTLPIRNWVLQQLVKLSVVEVLKEDILIFCDSDVTFVRPFDLSSIFLLNEKVPLLRVDFQSQDVISWTDTAKQLLGIKKDSLPVFNYVGNLIAWRRENVLKLHHHLEYVNETSWIQAICKYWKVSEYMLYGIMVDHVLGVENSGHFISSPNLVKSAWDYPLDSQANIDKFFGVMEESYIGVMVHSKYKVPVNSYQGEIELLWKKNC